jgi:hypothetical protein
LFLFGREIVAHRADRRGIKNTPRLEDEEMKAEIRNRKSEIK